MRQRLVLAAKLLLLAGVWVLLATIPPPSQGSSPGDDHVPPATALTPAAMRLLATFTATILALLTTDLHMGVVCAWSLSILVLTRSLSCTARSGDQLPCARCTEQLCGTQSESLFRTAMSGFADEVNWLVFAAFHIGRGTILERYRIRMDDVSIR
jgi:di/tricarboxylate transporter